MTLPTELASIPPRATGAILIDLARVRANWRVLSERVAPAECAAVVKADAYGLGAGHIVPALAAQGCRTFFVATPDEAGEVRRLAHEATIYVLDGLLDPDWMVDAGAQPVLSTVSDLWRWADASAAARRRLPAALQLDSGLNRLGLGESEVAALIAQPNLLGKLEISLIMSHLACADEPDHPKNLEQRQTFHRLRSLLPSARVSLAASDGLMLGEPYHYNLVRPGYALYGGQAFRGGRAPVEPVVSAYARVLQVREVAAGQSVGYSATWTARGPRVIATVAAGYADGVFRHASGSDGKSGGFVGVDGHLCPIVGRVSMDLVTVDVTAALGSNGSIDSAPHWVELIGPSLSLEQVGAHAGTIGYEVLTRLGRRFYRIYRGGQPG